MSNSLGFFTEFKRLLIGAETTLVNTFVLYLITSFHLKSHTRIELFSRKFSKIVCCISLS